MGFKNQSDYELSRKLDEEITDALITISVLAKRVATKMTYRNSKGEKHGKGNTKKKHNYYHQKMY